MYKYASFNLITLVWRSIDPKIEITIKIWLIAQPYQLFINPSLRILKSVIRKIYDGKRVKADKKIIIKDSLSFLSPNPSKSEVRFLTFNSRFLYIAEQSERVTFICVALKLVSVRAYFRPKKSFIFYH
jgi:hypothetical protein